MKSFRSSNNPDACDLAGKVVFVTGAARGIGAAVVQRIHRGGAHVVLVGLEPELLAALARDLGAGALAIEADVTNARAMERAGSEAVARFGGIDVVVANAGILHVGSVAESLPHHFDRTFEVNFHGVLRTLRATLSHVRARKGYVLNVASFAAINHGPLMGAYHASKAAVEALSNSMRIELARSGVGVGVAYFGAIDTDLVQGSRLHPAMAMLESMAPKVARRPLSVDEAARVVEHAIRRRSSRVWAPWWLGPLMAIRGATQPILEQWATREPRLDRALELAMPTHGGACHQDDLLGAARNVRPYPRHVPSSGELPQEKP